MSHSFTAAIRRAKRLLHPATLTRKTRSVQYALAGLMVTAAMAPLGALTPKKSNGPKAATASGVMPGAVARLTRLARGRNAATPRIPDGARYLARTHRSAAGSRSYKLYLPASHPKRPRGLIVMLHGCNQTPDDFAAGTHMNALAEKHGLAIAYPAQTRGQNAGGCWNWFRPAHQKRGAGEPAVLASLARRLARELSLGRDGVFVAGLSAGGAMAAILADVYPDVFGAAGVHSGLARGSASTVASAMSAMRRGGSSPDTLETAQTPPKPVRRIVFQGDTDGTVHLSNSARIVAAALGDAAVASRVSTRSVRGRRYARSDFTGSDGTVLLELWVLEGGGHAWSGGRAAGSYTDTKGPDASAQMIRFFLEQP